MPLNFSVPQFIEIEDKVVGPFTFKQFVYLAGGAALSFLLWKFLPSFIAIILLVPIGILSIALAFYRINNRPFVITLASAVRFHLSPKLYVWAKQEKKVVRKQATVLGSGEQVPIPGKLSGSKLKDIAWSLDVQNKIE